MKAIKILLLIGFAAVIFIFAAFPASASAAGLVYEPPDQEEPQIPDVVSVIAEDIRESGEQDAVGYVWHIKRLDDVDETEYELALTEDPLEIACSHEKDGFTYSLYIGDPASTAYDVFVQNTETGNVVAQGRIDPGAYVPGAGTTEWHPAGNCPQTVTDNIESEITLMVQLFQTHTVGHEWEYTIADLGFTSFNFCEIHAPGLRLVTKMPNCTESGTCEYDCRVCGKHITETLSPFRPEDQMDEDHKWKCLEVLAVQDVPHDSTASYTCKRCSADKVDSFCCKYVFDDFKKAGNFAHTSIEWAYLHGIAAGVGEGKFAPKDPCTRSQIVTFLWRAAGSPEATIADVPFKDIKRSVFYWRALLWAYESGITSGTSEFTFSPNNVCTRAQVVMFLWRSVGSPAPEGNEMPFDDIKQDAYYKRAVLWAVENGVTSGTAINKFSPDDPCTREQVTAFLYKLWLSNR